MERNRKWRAQFNKHSLIVFGKGDEQLPRLIDELHIFEPQVNAKKIIAVKNGT